MKSKDLNISTRSTHLSLVFYFVLLFSQLYTSCQGQDKNNIRVIDKTKSPVTSQYQDPLLYIEGQLCQHLRKIYQDKRGDLWMGTNVYDIMRYDGDSLSYITEKDGIVGGRVTGILEDKNGDVWFGSFGGLTKYDGYGYTKYMQSEDRHDNEVWSMLIDSKETFWVGASDGLKQFNGTSFIPFPIPKAPVKDTTTSYSEDRITALMEDKDGIIWIGTDGFGICRYDPSAHEQNMNPFSYLTKEDGLADNNIGDILQDRDGNVWIATFYGGISRYDGQAFTNFTQTGEIQGIETGALYQDREGKVWFAAENNGVYRYDGDVFQNYDQKDGLNTNGILSIYEDREGRFWLGGWGGLFRYHEARLNSGKQPFESVTKDGDWD